MHIVDSEIVRSMIQKESYGFNTFAATRTGEIQRITNPSEWFWREGSENIADIMTRGVDAARLPADGAWQNGPSFMSKPLEEWPVRNCCITTNLPDRTKIILTTVKEGFENLINITRFSKYEKLIMTTARIMSLKNKNPTYSLKNIFLHVSPGVFEMAEAYWVREAQSSIAANLELAVNGNGPYRRLNLEKSEDGIFVVGKRIAEWNEMSYNKQGIPILPKEHPISKLYVTYVHNRDHLGVSATVAKV